MWSFVRSLTSKGCGLIDTSNRTRKLTERSVLALASKNLGFSVLMKSSEKKLVFKKLMETKKYSENQALTLIHATKMYYSLVNHLYSLPEINICADGFNKGLLKHYLQFLLKEKFEENKINIHRSLRKRFSKKNIADRLAKKVLRGQEKPSLIITIKHFRQLNLIK